MKTILKYKYLIIIVILIITNLFYINKSNTDNDLRLNELHNENKLLNHQKDSLLTENDKLKSDYTKYDDLINVLTNENNRLSNNIKQRDIKISNLKKEIESYNKERKLIREKIEALKMQIERLASDKTPKSNEELIKGLKQKLNR